MDPKHCDAYLGTYRTRYGSACRDVRTYIELCSFGLRGGWEEGGGGLGEDVVDGGVHPVPVHRPLRIGPRDAEACRPQISPGLQHEHDVWYYRSARIRPGFFAYVYSLAGSTRLINRGTRAGLYTQLCDDNYWRISVGQASCGFLGISSWILGASTVPRYLLIFATFFYVPT